MSSAGSRMVRVGLEIVTFNAAKAISELNNYERSLTRLDSIGMKTARDMSSAWTQMSSGVSQIRTLDTAVKTLNQTFNASTPILQRWANNFKSFGPQIQTPLNQARAAMHSFNATFTQSSQRIIQDSQRIRAGFEQMGASMQAVTTRLTSLNSQFRAMDASVRMTDATMKTFNMDIDMMNQKLIMLNDNMQRTINSTMQYANSQKQASSSQKMVNDDIEANTEAVNKQGTAFQNTMTTLVPYISRMMNFGLTLSMATMAMDEANGMAAALGDSQEKVAMLTERHAEALEKFGKGSRQAESAARQLEDATRGLSFMERNAGMAARDVTYFMILLATSIIGTVLPAFSNWGKTVETATKAVDKLKGAIKGLATANVAASISGLFPAFGKASKGADDFGDKLLNLEKNALKGTDGMKTLTAGMIGATAASGGLRAMLGPIGVALAVVGSATALYATNFMGARDTMNEFGEAVGRTIPIFKPFGDALVWIAGSLGLTGETALQTKGHFDTMTDGFTNMSTMWNNTVHNMQMSDNAFISNLGFTVDAVGNSLTTMAGHFTTQVQASASTWGELMDAFARDDYRAAVDIIGQALADIPGIAATVLDDINKLTEELWNGLVEQLKLIQPSIAEGLKDLHGLFVAAWQHMNEAIYKAFSETGEFIFGFFGEIGSRIGQALGSASHIVTTWVSDNIIKPIMEFPSKIVIGAQMIWDAIIGTGTDILATVGTWAYNNIAIPLMQLPNRITGMAGTIVHNLLTGEWVGVIEGWLGSAADWFMTLPNYVYGVAEDIIHNLLSGNWIGKIQEWAGGVWNEIVNFFSGKTTGGEQKAFAEGVQNELDDKIQKGGTSGLHFNQETNRWEEPATIDPDTFDSTQIKLEPLKDGEFGPPKPQTGTSEYERVTVSEPEKPTGEKVTVPVPLDKQTKPIKTIITPETANVTPSGKQTTVTPQLTPYGIQQRDEQNRLKKAVFTSRQAEGMIAPEQNPYEFALGFEDEDIQQDIADKRGIGESLGKYKEIKEAVDELSVSTAAYNQLLSNQFGVEMIASQGTAKRRDELTMANVALVESRAYNDEYYRQIAAVEVLNTAYNQGIQDQRKALADQAVELAHNTGVIQERNDQMKTGVPQMLAYKEGINAQNSALIDQQLALEHSEGMTQRLTEQMKVGVPQFLAYKEGVDQQKNSLIDMQLETENTRGRIEELGSQLENNEIQAHAFMAAYESAKFSAMNMGVEVSALQGEIAYLSESLTNNTDILNRQNIAYLESQRSALEWGMSLQESLTANDGFRDGLIKTANALMTDLPTAFEGTNEDFQTFISLSLQAGEAYDSFIEGIESSADSVLSNLGSALTKSNDAFDEAIEKLEEEWGIKFSDTMKNVFESNAGVESINQTMTAMFTALAAGKEQLTDPTFFNDTRDRFTAKLNETWDDIREETTPEIDTMIQGLYDAINQDIPLTNEGILKWMSEIQIELEKLKNAGAITSEEFSTSLGALNELTFDQVKASLGDLEGGIVGVDEATGFFITKSGKLVDAMGEIQTGTAGIGDSASTATPKAQAFYDTLASFGGLASVLQTIFETSLPTHVETGLTTAVGHFEQFKTDVEGILNSIDMSGLGVNAGDTGGQGEDKGGIITPDNTGGEKQGGGMEGGFLSQMKTQLEEIPTLIQTSFVQGRTLAEAEMLLLSTNFQNTLMLMGELLLNFNNVLGTFWMGFGEMANAGFLAMMELSQNALTVVAEQFFNLNTVIGTFILGVGTMFNDLNVAITQLMNQAVQNAAGSFNSLNTHIAGVMGQINSNVSTVAVAMTQAFNTGAQNAAGVMNNLRGHVATVMGQIGTIVNTVLQGVGNAFVSMGNAAIAVMSGIDTAARVAAYAVGQIGVLAEAATQAVGELADALNALPNIERTITYTVEVVGSPPAQAGSPGIMGYQGHQVIVGENGREFVQLSKMAEGGIAVGDIDQKGFITNGMMRMTVPEDAMMTVVPLEGRNAQKFGEKYPQFKPLQDALKLEEGIVTAGTTTVKQGSNGATISFNGKVVIENGMIKEFQDAVDEFGDHVDDQNTGGGSGNGTGTGGNGGSPGSAGNSYIPGAGKPCPACTPNSGGTGNGNVGGGSGGGSGGNTQGQYNFQQNINGTQKYYRYNNGAVETNMTQAEIEQYIPERYQTNGGSSGGGTGGGSQTPGGNTGGGTGSGNVGNGGGSTYQRRPDTGPDGLYSDNEQRKFAGTADVGVSPAIKGNLARLPGINARNEVELTNGDRYTIEEWNALSDSKRARLAEQYGFFAIPEGSYVNEDYSITPHHYQRPLNSRSGPNQYDPNATRASGSSTGSGNVGSGGSTGGTGSGNSGQPDPANLELLTISGSTSVGVHHDLPSHVPMPKTKSGMWVANKTGANTHVEDWFIVRMKNNPNRWKIVDGDGINVAVDFLTWHDAFDFVQFVRKEQLGAGQAPVYRDTTTGKNYIQYPDGTIEEVSGYTSSDYTTEPSVTARPRSSTSQPTPNTGGGNVTPNGSMTPAEATAAGGTQEGYIKSGGWGANDNPEEWSVTTMKDDPNQWKVVDARGRNVATNFVSQEAAQDYIDARKNGGQGVDNSNITPQSQPNTSNGNVTPNANNNNGGTATTPGQTVTGGSGQNQTPGGGTGTPSSGGGNTSGGNVQQSQIVSQNSIVNQGNNSNVDMQSGQNSRLRIQNGQVVEATGIYAGYKIGDPLPGLGGGSGSGGGMNGIDLWKVKPIQNELSALMSRIAPDITFPEVGFDPMATQPENYDSFIEPLVREFGFNPSQIGSGGGTGGDGGSGGGGSGGNDAWKWIFKIFEKMTGLMDTLLGKRFNTGALWQDASNITARNVGSFL